MMDISDTILNITEIPEIKNSQTSVAEKSILKLLQLRFKADKPYTQLGQNKLIVVNPFKTIEQSNDAHLEAYGKNGYKNPSLSAPLEPHVYEMAARAYLLMRRKSQNQAIILRGFSGSGKSTTKQHIIKELLHLSTYKHKKENRHILGANTIFESFGTYKSTVSDTASCFGQFQTLDFDRKGRVVGCHISIFLFDKFRVASSDQFNIFYQLLAGASSDEKRALHIHQGDFNYLKHQHLRSIEHDSICFNDMKEAMKACGFKTKTVAQICQLLAAILHLGNIQFATVDKSTGNESCCVINHDTLGIVASALGTNISTLETSLTHKVKLVKDEFCTEFLTPEAAINHRDSLARTLYTVLILWITKALNQKYENRNGDHSNSISILDTIGFARQSHRGTFYDLCSYYVSERLYSYCYDYTVNPESAGNSAFISDCMIPKQTSLPTPYYDMSLLTSCINQESQKTQTADDSGLLSQLFQKPTIVLPSTTSSFAIRHFDTFDMDYSVEGFLESNLDLVPPEFIRMFQSNCSNEFVHHLFETDSFAFDTHLRDKNVVIKAQFPTWSNINGIQTVFDQLSLGVEKLKETLDKANLLQVLHLAPNDQQKPGEFDLSLIQQQISTLRLADLVKSMDPLHGVSLPDFILRYQPILNISDEDGIIKWVTLMQLDENDIKFGKTKVWMAFQLWRALECQLRSNEKEVSQQKRAEERLKDYEKADYVCGDDITNDSFYDDFSIDDYRYGSSLGMSAYDIYEQSREQIEEVNISGSRKWWTRFVYLVTWWIPNCLLKYIGKMSRPDIQLAWREKVTLCLLIFLFSGGIIFFIVGLGEVICPGTDDLYTLNDISVHRSISDYWVSVRGKVYDMTNFVATDHGTPVYPAGKSNVGPLAGLDLSYTFPPPLTIACSGLVSDPAISVTPNETTVLGPFVHFSSAQQPGKLRDPQWLNKYFGPTMDIYKKGDIVFPMKQIQDDFKNWGRAIASIDNKIYDLTDYMATALKYPKDIPGAPNYHYLDSSVEFLFTKFGGKDVTEEWNKYTSAMDEHTRARNKACLDNVFYIGLVDYRDSARCTFINYLLLSFAIIMCVVIVVKFLAALQFGSAPSPEDHDRFVICQVPCYTEDEESLRKTIESITAMEYDDKHKLLFLIADGMIIGSGNDKPTPQILLEILGHHSDEPLEVLMFKSIGEGSKQLNYGKVYSGMYQHEGHVVPYIVVVKVGKSSEQTKPGNRGKRDSQIICMNFLSKVHFDSEMTPLELEIYYHMKYIIGIEPILYEYILMVDSDTEVYPDSLNKLISCMSHDSRIIGLCGETELGNEGRSWATMIQVYEYYISHHLVKSFESLFGSVTCLPGCFCMYRIRTPIKNQPLIISPSIINAYSDNQVDTLHKKNLLHLGEDRYLTTLMMKTFPQYKMMFTPYAKCKTVAPEEWRVLLSQRRRWINSTIHNLLELILLPQLCGFCCFSMRFVVMTDLIGTITLPSSVVYLIYLLYQVISGSGPVPTIALGMFAGAYGLQSLIFIFKRQWEHIGWMIIYILAIPIFSFFIPLYAFWHFDDFSWGNTRVVLGDKTKQIIIKDDEKFDEKMIPLRKWSVFEQEMIWETKTLAASMHSISSKKTYHRHHKKHDDIRSQSTYRPSCMSRSTSRRQPLIPDFMENNEKLSIDMSSVFKSSPDTFELGLPEDSELEEEIKIILDSSDLASITKKQVRDHLSVIFGVDLTIKKNFINAVIERLLKQD